MIAHFLNALVALTIGNNWGRGNEQLEQLGTHHDLEQLNNWGRTTINSPK